MTAATENVLACWRAIDLVIPGPDSVLGHHCAACGCGVWVAKRNLALGFKLLCRPCAKVRIERTGDTVVRPASEAHP